MSVHSARSERALARLAEVDPALGALSLWCLHEDGDTGDLPAISTAQGIVYGKAFTALRPEEQEGLAAHHILQIALRHHARARAMQDRQAGGFDAALFALACDCILNEMLQRAGYALPRPAVLLTDVLIDRLQADAADALSTWDIDTLYLALQAGDQGAKSGRSGDGFKADFQPAETDSGAEDDASDWHQRLAAALEAGRLAGTGIGRLAGILTAGLETRTPWETLLRTRLQKALSFAPRPDQGRPARRWMALADEARRLDRPEPPFEPGRARQSQRPRLGVALDMSGSVADAQLDRFASHVATICRRTGAETHVMTFDTGVGDIRVVDPANVEAALTALPRRRDGGTDFGPVIAEAERRDLASLVILTDLDGPHGPKPKRLPVLWAVDAPPVMPPFGTVLRLDR